MATDKVDSLLSANAIVADVYDLPSIVQRDSGYKTISVKQLSSADELVAADRCRGNAIRLATELAKAALCAVDGSTLQFGDGSVDVAWEKLGQRGRQLVLTALNNNTTMDDGDVTNFLQSKRTVA